MSYTTIVHATVVRPHADRAQLSVEANRTVVLKNGVVESIGNRLPETTGKVLNAGGRLVTPGLIDAHTHALFLGDRASEFCARATGASYLDIARDGGGILATVWPTRNGSAVDRRRRLRARLKRLLANGVTTAEVKTGYGLTRDDELKHMEELATLDEPDLPRVLPTLMAAHAIPPEAAGDPSGREKWVRTITDELIPEAAERALVGRVDAFVEETAYTPDEARIIARATRRANLALHLHVDQLSAGNGALLAAELHAQAAAHLEHTDPQGVAALAKAGTVAILLPTATLTAKEPLYAPARRLLSAGVAVALSTNLNPGTAPTESTALMFFLASVKLGLTPEETLWAATRGGARALGLDTGRLEPGSAADLVVWNAFDLAHLSYHAGINHVRQVILGGKLVLDRSVAADEACHGLL